MEHNLENQVTPSEEQMPPDGMAAQSAVVWELSRRPSESQAAPEESRVSDLDAYRERKAKEAPSTEAGVTRWALPGREKQDAAQWLIMVSSGFGTPAPAVIRPVRSGSGDTQARLAA
ncbi:MULTISPECIES: hypothetical protein [Paenibacillus]|uniref:hypothetical protein n=1 Tax=Paenibacillus TaxID=44249 RepID=UPI0022B8C066|nr:hypothetical protein [Paenibacillus caseinilyticus]MCZ8520773.1 hypothetical protein [Paenibacillus caseinilyticus]